jgi:hypothetical protein
VRADLLDLDPDLKRLVDLLRLRLPAALELPLGKGR